MQTANKQLQDAEDKEIPASIFFKNKKKKKNEEVRKWIQRVIPEIEILGPGVKYRDCNLAATRKPKPTLHEMLHPVETNLLIAPLFALL